jgi:Lrp/AsnC family transcriptional regulator, leucine-responsive regulatory protein
MAYESPIMDTINWRIIELLQKDGRISMAELSRQLGLSIPTVTERVHKLENAGIIKGYTARIDLEKIGLGMGAFITLRSLAGRCAKTAEAVYAIPEVLACHRVTGQDCYILRVAFRNMNHLEHILDQLNPLGDTVSALIVSSPIETRLIDETMLKASS